MSSPNRAINTVYFQYVSTNLPLRLAEGQGCYSVEDCARLLGLKPTHNFRKRVKQLAQTGVLTETPAFNARGNVIAVYSLPEVTCNERYPF